MQVRELTESEVEMRIHCEPEQEPFVGNCSCIDDATDRQAEQRIREQLERGNDWAWCCVVVTASWEQFVGRSCLGGCSYRSEAEFCQSGGYFDDLKAEALAELNRAVQRAAVTLAKLQII